MWRWRSTASRVSAAHRCGQAARSPSVAGTLAAAAQGAADRRRPSRFDASPVNYISVPSGTPKEVIDRLNREVNAVLATPEIRDYLVGNGVIPKGERSPRWLPCEDRIAKWKQVIEVSGAKLE
jgi:hypothetical protein